MKKGFGFYSPHESTVLLLKTILISVWLGIDLVSALIMSTFPPEVFMNHGLVILFILILLFSGTIFSLLLVWSTGVLFGRNSEPVEDGFIKKCLSDIKQDHIKFVAAGFTGIAICMLFTLSWIAYKRNQETWTPEKAFADPAIYKKCAEIAELEGGLFNKSKQTVIEECLSQYDDKNNIRQNTTPPNKREKSSAPDEVK